MTHLILNLTNHCKLIPSTRVTCCGIFFFVQFEFCFPLFSTHTLPYPKTKENKISTKGKIEPQDIHVLFHL